MLSQAQREHRHQVRIKQHRKRVRLKKQAELDDPNQLTQPLTPRLLNRETQAAVKLRYGGEESNLRGQVRASGVQQQNITHWYDDYLNRVNAAAQSAAQVGQQTAAQIGAVADKSSATDAGNRTALIAQMQADAAKRGATVDPSVGVVGAQAEASRRAGLDEAQAGVLRTNADQALYLGDRGRIGAGQAVQAHQQESNRKRAIKDQLRSLRAEKGDYAVQYRSTARQNERTAQSTEAALGLKVKAQRQTTKHQNRQDRQANTRLSLTAAHNAALEAIAQQNANTSAGRARTARQQDAYKRRNHLGPYARHNSSSSGGPTRSQRVSAQNNLSKARNLIHAHPEVLQGATAAQVISGLTAKGVPADIARAAYQYHYFGGVKSALRRKLAHKYGLHTKKAGKKHRVASNSDAGLGALGTALTNTANSVKKG